MSGVGTVLLALGLISLAIFVILLTLIAAFLIFIKFADDMPMPLAIVGTIFIMSLISAIILIPLGILIA